MLGGRGWERRGGGQGAGGVAAVLPRCHRRLAARSEHTLAPRCRPSPAPQRTAGCQSRLAVVAPPPAATAAPSRLMRPHRLSAPATGTGPVLIKSRCMSTTCGDAEEGQGGGEAGPVADEAAAVGATARDGGEQRNSPLRAITPARSLHDARALQRTSRARSGPRGTGGRDGMLGTLVCSCLCLFACAGVFVEGESCCRRAGSVCTACV